MTKIVYNNNFNLLRFLFASLVIISHTPELQNGNRSREILTSIFGTISFGELAVDSFFILSGFLIVKSWQEKPNISNFLSSRILRIQPAFVVSALICALIIGPMYSHVDYFHELKWGKFILGLATLQLHGIPSVFPETPYSMLNGALWTISYEFRCYLLVLIVGLANTANKRWFWLALLIICTFIHITNRIETMIIPKDTFFRFLMCFSTGSCFYLYKEIIPWTRSTALTGLCLLPIFLFSKILAESAICIFWGYAIIFYALNGTSLLKFNKFPDVSYGIYLYAWPISKIIFWHYPTMNMYSAMTLTFIFALLSGIASWHFVEKPFLQFKYRHYKSH